MHFFSRWLAIVKGKQTFLVIFVLLGLLSFLLRFYQLANVPAGLHFDEAFSGYNAFLLGQTGKSISGEFLPIYVDAFGDYRPAMIVYLTVPFVKALGLTIFSTRLPSAIASTLLPVLAYALVMICYNKRRVGYLAALFTAISSYALIMGRSTTEGVIDVCFGLSAVICLLLAFKQGKLRWLGAVYVLWIAAYFSYMSARVLIPLFALTTIFFAYLQFKPQKKLLICSLGLVLLYLVFPFGYFFRSPIGTGRFNQVSVFSYKEVQLLLDERIREDGVAKEPILASRFYHNKVIGFTYDIAERYITFLSPSLMLFHIPQPERYYVSAVGPLYVFEFVGLVFAILTLLRKKHPPLFILPLALLLWVPLPASLTAEAFPNFSRVIYLVPLWQICGAFGLNALFKRKSMTTIVLVSILTGLGVWQFIFFQHQYFIHQPLHYPSISDRRSEMEPLAQYLERAKGMYPKMLVSEHSGAYIYYLFFNKLSVFDQQVKKDSRYFTDTFEINHITFLKLPCPRTEDLLETSYDLVVMRQECDIPPLLNLITAFYRTDGSVGARAYAVRKSDYASLKAHLANPKVPIDEAIWNEYTNSRL